MGLIFISTIVTFLLFIIIGFIVNKNLKKKGYDSNWLFWIVFCIPPVPLVVLIISFFLKDKNKEGDKK